MQYNYHGIAVNMGYFPKISWTAPHLAKLFGTSDSQHQGIGIGHPTYTTETGKESNSGNTVADQAYNDPIANTKELMQIYETLKQAATAYYGDEAQQRQNDAAAVKAIAAITSADTEAKVLNFVNQNSTFSGAPVHSYSYWVEHNTFTGTKWSASEIDNSIVAPKPQPRYITSPDGMKLDTQTGKVLWGPGPKW